MKTVKGAAIALAASLLGAGVAHAEWYIGGNGGVSFSQDEDISGRNSTGDAFRDKSKNDTGYALQVNAGYDFKGPRVEAELGYQAGGLKSLTDTDGKIEGQTTALSLMVNGVYQFLPRSKWHPFVGAGVGVTRLGADWKADNDRLVKDTDWVFAYQGMTGVSYDLTRNWGINAQYRYFSTQDASFHIDGGGTAEFGYSSHSLLAGVTYRFGK